MEILSYITLTMGKTAAHLPKAVDTAITIGNQLLQNKALHSLEMLSFSLSLFPAMIYNQ
jgi:hypothetical protein